MTTPTRVLLIDGDAARRAALADALTLSNLPYVVTQAADADAALAAAAAPFDAMLLDGELPGAEALLAALSGAHAVIALSDDADSARTLALLGAGAMDVLARTQADPATLARAVRAAAARRGFAAGLEARAAKAERLGRRTTLLLSTVAHDLRNPFQALLVMSELLSEAASGADPKVTRRAEIVREAATQAHGLLDSLLSWASVHLTSGGEPAPLDALALLEDCALAMRARAEEKGVRLDVQPAPGRVFAQPDATAAILRNLAANAIKFTPSGGQVTLCARPRGASVALAVVDTGVGMGEAQVATLFDAQRRRTSSGTGGENGAGLGLLLCRALAESFGGELEVDSAPGAGSTFRLVLPAARD